MVGYPFDTNPDTNRGDTRRYSAHQRYLTEWRKWLI